MTLIFLERPLYYGLLIEDCLHIKAIRNYQFKNEEHKLSYDTLPHLEHDAGDEPCLRRIVGEEVVDGAQVYRLLLGWNKFNDLILQPIDIIK